MLVPKFWTHTLPPFQGDGIRFRWDSALIGRRQVARLCVCVRERE